MKHVKRIEKAIPGVEAGDVESLHQLRVNIRRLRNALWIWKDVFPRKRREAWNDQLRKLAGATSAGRDLDVFVIFLDGYRTRTDRKEQLEILEEALFVLNDKKKRLQRRMGDALAKKKLKRVWRDIENYSRDGVRDLGETDIYKLAYKKIKKRAVGLVEFDGIAQYPEKVNDLHNMRIAAKHLRYTLEGLSLLYDEGLDVFSDSVLTFHRQLGVFHDYDLWLREIMILEQRSPGKGKAARNLWKLLKGYLQKEKETVYIQFFERWQQAKEQRTFENMCEYVYAWFGGL